MNIVLATSILFASLAVPIDTSTTRILNDDGTRCDIFESGINYLDENGMPQPRDVNLMPTTYDGFGWQIAASDHQLYCPTDEWRFRIEHANSDDGVEYSIADVGIHYYDGDTGSDVFQSFNWDMNGVAATVENNVWTGTPYPNMQYTLIAGWLGTKTNIIWDVSSMTIPMPTEIIDATATMDGSYISMVYDIQGWPDTDVWISGQEVPDGAMWHGASVQFRDGDENIFSIPQTQSFRNPTVSILGDNFTGWDLESDVLYYVDRVNSRLYVDVPYELFLDADTVLVDPTFDEGEGGFGEAQFLYFLQDNQSRQKTDGDTCLLYEDGSTPRWGCLIFSGLSSISGSAIVSGAQLRLKTDALTDNPSWVHIANLGCSTTPVAKTPVADYNPLTDPGDHNLGYPTGWYFNWYHAAELWGKPNNGPPADTYVGAMHREEGMTASSEVLWVSGTDMIAATQAMIANTSGDAFIIWGESNDCYTEFFTHGAAAAGDRPQLSVTYTVPDMTLLMNADQMWAAKGSAIAKMITNPTTNPIYSIVEVNNVTMHIASATAHYELSGADFDLHAATEVLPGQYLLHFVDSDFELSEDAVATIIYEPTYGLGGGSYVKGNPYTLDYGTSSSSSSSAGANDAQLLANQYQILEDISFARSHIFVASDTAGSGTWTVSIPSGQRWEEGNTIQISCISQVYGTTPAMYLKCHRDGAGAVGGEVFTWHGNNSIDHVEGNGSNTTRVDHLNFEEFIIYHVVSSSDVSAGTGVARVIVEASAPIPIEFSTMNEITAKGFYENDFLYGDTIDETWRGVLDVLDKLDERVNNPHILIANQDIAPITDVTYPMEVGNMNCYANQAAVIFSVTRNLDTGIQTVEDITFLHHEGSGSAGSLAGWITVASGAWEVAGGRVISATWGDYLRNATNSVSVLTGRLPDEVSY